MNEQIDFWSMLFVREIETHLLLFLCPHGYPRMSLVFSFVFWNPCYGNFFSCSVDLYLLESFHLFLHPETLNMSYPMEVAHISPSQRLDLSIFFSFISSQGRVRFWFEETQF